MKKILAIFLAVLLLVSVCHFGMFDITASAETSDYFTYSVSSGEATITDVDASISGDVVIPSTLGGYPVTSIGDLAFFGCESLTSVTIPDSVTSISEDAFRNCSSLTSVTIGNGVTSIGDEAFRNCSSLTSVTIGNSVTSIGDLAFYCCGLTSITIPDSVTSIADRAFRGCGLTSITVESDNLVYHSKDNCLIETASNELILGCKNSIIPNYVTSIGYCAFSNCSGLTSITIPDSVTSIGDYAFSWCTGLTSITISDSVTSIGQGAFHGCESLTSVTIGNSVTSIGQSAFCGCESLTSVTIPDSVTSISEEAFMHCSGLTSVTIGNGVTSIGYCAFSNCSGLTSVTIGNGVTSIGESAFSECSSLTSITIPDSVTSIDWYAFDCCIGLTSITIPDSVTSIGDYAFRGCDSLVIYCNENSYAMNYAIENDIKYCIEKFVEKGDSVEYISSISTVDSIYRDIAINYPGYLDNKLVNEYISAKYDSCVSVLESYSDWEIVGLAFTEGFFKGTEHVSNKILSYLGFQTKGDEWIKEATMKLLSKIEQENNVIYDSWDKIKENYDHLEVAYDAAESATKVELVRSLSNSSNYLKYDDITQIVEDACERSGELGIGKVFDATGDAFDIVDLTITACQLYDVQIETIKTLMQNISSDSTLYKGLEMVKEDRQKNAAQYVIDNFLQKKVAKKIGELIEECGKYCTTKLISKNVSITLAVVTVTMEIFYEHLYTGVKITDINEATILGEFYQTMCIALTNEHIELLNANINGTQPSEQVLNDYKWFWGARLSALSTLADTCIELDKYGYDAFLETFNDNYQATVGFDSYIFKCSDALRKDLVSGSLSCEHYLSYMLKKVVSTCSEEGYTIRHCLTCGSNYVSESYALEGHDYETEVITPTCNSQGYTIYSCKNCRYTYNGDFTESLEHDFVTTVVPESCMVRGYTNHVCQNCGAQYKDNYTTTTGHTYKGWNIEKLPTCTKNGLKSNECSVCSTIIYLNTPRETHEFGDIIPAKQGADCKTKGTVSYKVCTVCKNMFEADATIDSHESLDSIVGDYGEHNWVEQATLESVCNKVQSIAYDKCSVCDKYRVDEDILDAIPTVAGHNYIKKQLTSECLAVAAIPYKECACGQLFDNDGNEIDALAEIRGHSFDKQTVADKYLKSAATCTAPAIYYKSCECGAEGTETFENGEALGHDYADATCTVPMTCNVCGDTKGEALGHDYNKQVVASKYLKSAATCTAPAVYHYSCECGEEGTETFESGEALGHDYADATCTVPMTCNVCGDTKGEALGHDYNKQVVASKYLKSAATCTAPAIYYKSCECGEKGTETFENGEALGHDYADATCTVPMTCNVCSDTKGEALGHDYAAATCKAPKTCKVCSATTGSKLSHKSDSGTVTKKATCTATGTKTYKCTLCKEAIETETIAKVAHKYDSGKVTKAATCKATGVKTYTCSVCKGTKTETIAKLTTHTYSNNCDKSCNVCGATRSVGAHKYSNSCDTTCNYCNAKRTIKHTYTNNCDTSCNVCKAKRTIKHTYSNNCDTSCNVCKATRTITHTYKTTTTKATLSKNGSIVKKCTVCGKVASNTAIKYAKTFKLSTTSYTYNGKVKTPSVTVKDSAGNTLKKNTDYTVTYASGRKNAGTYKVTIKMKGNYTGTKTLTFKIKPAKLSSFKLSDTSYTYNGKTKTPSVTVKNVNGTKMTKNKHYTVTYSSGRKNVGTYKVTIKGKGNYTGTKTLTFKINPVKTTVSKLTAGKKSITVAITKKSTQVTGYQIQYSTSKSFSKATTKTISSYKTTKYTLKSLSAKKTYYVRVRTYKTVGKTKYYSGWSTYKYVKTK